MLGAKMDGYIFHRAILQIMGSGRAWLLQLRTFYVIYPHWSPFPPVRNDDAAMRVHRSQPPADDRALFCRVYLANSPIAVATWLRLAASYPCVKNIPVPCLGYKPATRPRHAVSNALHCVLPCTQDLLSYVD